MISQNLELAKAVSEADMVIEQLSFFRRLTGPDQISMLHAALDDAAKLIKRLQGEATSKLEATPEDKPDIYFASSGSKDGTPPSKNLSDHAKYMRKGSIRRVDRYLRIEPLFIVCTDQPGEAWNDRFRVVDSEKAAEGVKILHNI